MLLFLQLSNAYLGSEKRGTKKCSVFVTNLTYFALQKKRRKEEKRLKLEREKLMEKRQKEMQKMDRESELFWQY